MKILAANSSRNMNRDKQIIDQVICYYYVTSTDRQ